MDLFVWLLCPDALRDILNVDIDLTYVHSNHVFNCRSNLFLDGRANVDDVDVVCYNNVEVSRDSIVLNGQGYTLSGNFTSKKARPLIIHLGHTYDARN